MWLMLINKLSKKSLLPVSLLCSLSLSHSLSLSPSIYIYIYIQLRNN
jgi:hypothetical protein